MKKKGIIVFGIFIIIMPIMIFATHKYKIAKEQSKEFKMDDIPIDVELTYYEQLVEHYNKYVKTTDQIKLYNENSEQVGIVTKDEIIELEEIKIDKTTKYFQTKINDELYYLDYYNLEKAEKPTENIRYEKYILFNENIKTNNETTFYDNNNKIVYKINKSFNLPILIKEDDSYGVVFNKKLLYIKKENVTETFENQNTDELNSYGIPVLNYHYVYEENDTGCQTPICHPISQIESHFQYIKDNNYFTPTMKELEMYIDGKIQLPQKSVVLTFDDGTGDITAKKLVDKYEVNATVFLISSWFNKEDFESPYFEVHSHGHNIHNGGLCAGGQGGEIKCMEHDKLLEDLKTSRERLNNTTVFCYPFYEYNEYSISVLKEAGFTMAFAGEKAGGHTRVVVGANKFRLPRWVVVNTLTMQEFINYIG